MNFDNETLKNLRNIVAGKKVVEGKLNKTFDMSDPATMTDLLEAQKSYGAKVDLVSKELFGFSAAELTPEQWGKVKKVLDIISNHAAEPKVEELPVVDPIVDAPAAEEIIAPALDVEPMVAEKKKEDKVIGDLEKEEGDKEEKELKSKT